jgi:formate hydrogenlyase subunit 6/NADH:ubiquinone oxidoreductase subunit I
VKACPKDAINFKTDFDMVCYDKADTIYRWKKSVQENSVEDAKVEIPVQPNNSQQGLEV